MAVLRSPFPPNEAVNPAPYTAQTPASPPTWEDVYALVDANFAALAEGGNYVLEHVTDLANLPAPDYPSDRAGLTADVIDAAGGAAAVTPQRYALLPTVGTYDYGSVGPVDGAVQGQSATDGTERWWVPLVAPEVQGGGPVPPRPQDRFVISSSARLRVTELLSRLGAYTGQNIEVTVGAGQRVRFETAVPWVQSPFFPQVPQGPATASTSATANTTGDAVAAAAAARVAQTLPRFRPRLTVERREVDGPTEATSFVVGEDRVSSVAVDGVLRVTGSDAPGPGTYMYVAYLHYADVAEGAFRQLVVEVS